MSKTSQNRGKCAYCGQELARAGMSRHLNGCEERTAALAKADEGEGSDSTFYHLQVEDAWEKAYWLHLEVDGSAKMENLDSYLRRIWLECCGHLSEFSAGGRRGGRISMSRKVHQVFAEGGEVVHVYDFGTESVTRIKALGAREGKKISKRPIVLMARNSVPLVPCQECGQDGTYLCQECQFDQDRPGWLCEEHLESHPHDNYGPPFRIVNSPRLGLCGYVGPADPPY